MADSWRDHRNRLSLWRRSVPPPRDEPPARPTLPPQRAEVSQGHEKRAVVRETVKFCEAFG
jgi:hypothetical protein